MKIINILVAIASIMFLMIGIDKFFPFLKPPCSLENNIPPLIWKVFGVLQIASAFLLWSSKFRKHVAGFFMLFMLSFSIYHISKDTYDIGGSVFMAILLAIIYWNSSFLGADK